MASGCNRHNNESQQTENLPGVASPPLRDPARASLPVSRESLASASGHLQFCFWRSAVWLLCRLLLTVCRLSSAVLRGEGSGVLTEALFTALHFPDAKFCSFSRAGGFFGGRFGCCCLFAGMADPLPKRRASGSSSSDLKLKSPSTRVCRQRGPVCWDPLPLAVRRLR